MVEDIRENEMSSGVPVKLRGIDAEGKSVTTAPADVISLFNLCSRNYLFDMHSDDSYYVLIYQMVVEYDEGFNCNLGILLYGGNNYAEIPAITIISLVYHRGNVKVVKNCLAGGIEIGYSNNNGIVKLFIRTERYNTPVTSITLYKTHNVSLIKDNFSYDKPSGYTVV